MSDPLDQAEALSRAERDAGVQRLTAALQEAGSLECADCGDALSAARKAAAPWATRCVACQQKQEMAKR